MKLKVWTETSYRLVPEFFYKEKPTKCAHLLILSLVLLYSDDRWWKLKSKRPKHLDCHLCQDRQFTMRYISEYFELF